MTKLNNTALELLAPARDIECGIAAIDHGADAVYIGAERFGARAAAGNSTDDIRRLCDYAHTFRAKVYVTLNTILFDNELESTERLAEKLYHAGTDAIIVQDMALLKMNLPPMALHASTQMDNRTSDKVRWLSGHGFSRVVLARELSADDIRKIHKDVPDAELEVFVHGALCVSYSGLCYASQQCFGRSANRGECAQFCRLRFDLEDSDGRLIENGRHLLSLKDMCQHDNLEALVKAGATSFKIEGRLKDAAYVKNVTAAYSEKLNEIISRNPGMYRRASIGRCRYTFVPNLNKTFNRGFTDYFINGRKPGIASFDTPKAMGESVGRVKEIKGASFNVSGTAPFANGDGLCFLNDKRELEGFRVNKVVNNRIFPLKMPANLRPGTALYRNNDQAFEKLLSHKSSERKIQLAMSFDETDDGFKLTAEAGDTAKATVTVKADKQDAMKPQRENMIRQLTKLGNSPFECAEVRFPSPDFNRFIPSSLLADMRRQVTEELTKKLHGKPDGSTTGKHTAVRQGRNEYPKHLSYLHNVSNSLSRRLYEEDGHDGISDAFEIRKPAAPLLMQCRHCIRYSLGYCTKHGGQRPDWHEPLFLKLSDGRRFRLQFDCSACQMNIYAND